MPTAKLYLVRPDFSLAFFRKGNFGISGSAKSNRKTKQRFLNISSAVIDVSNVSRDENPQTENEMDSPSFEVFYN